MTNPAAIQEAEMDNVERNQTVLEARDIVKTFRSNRRKGLSIAAVDHVSLAVARGEMLVIVGESGSGKSTVGRILLDLIRPDQGDVLFRGNAITQLNKAAKREYRRSVQTVFQNPQLSFNPSRTIGGSIREALKYSGRPVSHERVETLLGRVQLGALMAHRRPDQMSGGELQRAAIACALATDPEVLFLDEPTSALDASIRGQIINVLITLQQSLSASLIWVTHELPVALAIADRIIVMYFGQVVEQGTVDQVAHTPRHPYSLMLLGGSAHASAESAQFGAEDDVGGGPVAPYGPGCRFAPRCPWAQSRCWNKRQHLQVIDGRLVRCWRSSELAAHGVAVRDMGVKNKSTHIREGNEHGESSKWHHSYRDR